MRVRLAGAVGTLGLPALLVWYRDEDWRFVLVACLVGGLVGLGGAASYWMAMGRRRDAQDLTGWWLSASGTVALLSGLAAWWAGRWNGVESFLGAAAGGAGVGCWLLFARYWILGEPGGAHDGPGSPDPPR